jgi:hypothetical protein
MASRWRSCKVYGLSGYTSLVTTTGSYDRVSDKFYAGMTSCVSRIEYGLRSK